MTWKELLYIWTESERQEPKTKKKCIRFTEKQEKILQEMAWEAGYEDASSFVRMLIRKFLLEKAKEE